MLHLFSLFPSRKSVLILSSPDGRRIAREGGLKLLNLGGESAVRYIGQSESVKHFPYILTQPKHSTKITGGKIVWRSGL